MQTGSFFERIGFDPKIGLRSESAERKAKMDKEKAELEQK